ncbi:MAG: hypothetical protein KDK36_04125, partial [Leptospiraceae bacterium]|nr:hypothetical protein [Leptospiraceae bacterium]
MKFGPELVYLTDRLINCPGIFLSEPFTITKKKGLSTITIYSDLNFFICEKYCDSKEITGLTLKESNENINYLTIIQITCYLLFDLFFQNKK